MSVHPFAVETRLAVIEQRDPELVLVHYRPGAVLDGAGIAEVLAACNELSRTGPFGMVYTVPPDVQVNMRVLQNDYFKEAPALTLRIRAMAVVSSTELFHQLTDIYFSYHPQRFRAENFSTEQEALDWLAHQAEDRPVA